MSTETNEFAVPEVVGDGEKDAIKEIKATKRPAEVSTIFNNSYASHHHFFFECGRSESVTRVDRNNKYFLVVNIVLKNLTKKNPSSLIPAGYHLSPLVPMKNYM